MAGFEDIKGLGPVKVEKLRKAGIRDLEDLASLDLRRDHGIGIGNDVLRDAKRQARRLLDAEGRPYSKAPYGANGGSTPRASPKASKERAETAAEPSGRRGFFARLFRRD